MDALVMAGGRGTRLAPLTFSLPKPLLPVGERPIIEIVIRQLRRQGFRRVFVSIGHKGHLIRAFLSEAHLDGIEVGFLSEDEPLGTAGALGLLPDDVDGCFVINGDILTDVDFSAVLRGHTAQDEAWLTAVVHHHAVTLPYGVLTLDEHRVTAIDEKPTIHLPVATGMYAIDRRALSVLPAGRFDMPDLIRVLASDGRVRAHPVIAFWTDVADLADYEHVNLEAARWSEL